MKRKFLSIALVATGIVAFSSCNNAQPKVEEKTTAAAPTELKIAYVEVDSIMTQYRFAKEYTEILEKKGQNIQSTLNQKGQALQNAVANFQQKVQQNAYTREQAEAVQALVALGYGSAESMRAVKKTSTECTTVEDILKEALKFLF